MGCLNNRLEMAALPTAAMPETEQPRNEETHQGGIAFDIPVNQGKARKKPPRLNKQLYIIREVSNLNHQLVESPLKQHKNSEQKHEEKPKQEEEYLSVPIKPRNRTKTTHEITSKDDDDVIDDKKSEVKTANLIPSDHQIDESSSKMAKRMEQRRQAHNSSKHSDKKSQRSDRYNQPEEQSLKKRRGSLDENTLGQHSIHFKRAKTLHSQNQLVFPSKSISIKGETEALSALPVFIERPVLADRDYESDIKVIITKEGEESQKLLEIYHNLTVQLEKKREIEPAIAANSKYLKLARKLHGVQSCSYAAGLSVLSSLYYSFSHFQKAVENSMKAKSIRPYAGTENDMHKARVLNEIGLIQLQQSHLKEATHYLEEVKEIHAKVLSEFKIDYQDFMASIAPVPSKNHYYDKCVQSMELALKICTRVFGENHLQTANHLDDLGTAYLDAGRTEESLQCYGRCFNIMRAMRMTKHKDFQSHAKHFQYNLQLIKLSNNPKRDLLVKALEILQGFFPEDTRAADFKAMVSSAKQVSLS